MDYSKLKSGFIEYLKTKYKTSRINPNKFDNLDKDSSIFLYANDFKEYLKQVNSKQGLNLSVKGEISTNDENALILNAINDAQTDNLKSDNDLLLELMNSFLSDENVKKQVDKDGDGTLNNDEVNEFFKNSTDGDNVLTFDELSKLYNEIAGGNNTDSNLLAQNAAQQFADSSTGVQSSSGSSGSGGSSGGSSDGSSGSGGGGGSYDTSSNGNNDSTTPDVSTKAIENMTEEELESKIKETNGEIETAKGNLSKYLDGSEPDSSAMDSAYEEYTKAIGEEKTKELDSIKTEVANKEAEIADKINEITTQQDTVTNAQTKYDNANNKLNSLTDKETQLKSALSSADEDKKADIQSELNNISSEIAQAKEDKTNAENELKEAKEKLEQLEGEKTKLDSELEAKQQELQEKEEEVTAGDENIKALQEKYDTEKANFETAKQDGIKQAQDTINTKNSEISALQSQKQKVKTDSEIDKQYKTQTAEGIPANIISALDGKLGSGFCQKVAEVAEKIGCKAQDLLAVMSFESGISPSIVNKSSGATGLIQFMPGVAKGLGTTTQALKQMSAVEQMEYVEKYLVSRKQANIPDKKELNAGDVYSLVFLPGYANKEELCHRGGKYYGSNQGLDRDKDGKITKTDLNNAAWGAYKNVMKKFNIDIKTV